MKDGFRLACLVLVLLAAADPAWALEPVGPASEAVLQALREQIGGEPTTEDLVDTLNQVTVYLYQTGQYAQAEPPVQEALALAERDLGREHPRTLDALNNLAELYRAQGRYDEAEPLSVRALEANERILGRDRPDILTSLNNLAMLYHSQGHYGKAEPLLVRALEASERILGQDHPQTLLSVNNLAMLYHSQGRYDEAEPLYKRALEARERILGQDHPDTLGNLNNLAELYRAQGRYGKAESLYLRTLEAHERVLGQDHPTTLTSLNNLAALYENQGRYGEAEPLYERALEGKERTLGQDHPGTLNTQLNLAGVLIASGQRDRAVQELRRMDEHLRRFVGDQLATTYRERVRRHWLLSESKFQDAVFSLALQHPEPDALRLAANVLLRWKRLAGEAEALIARLVRTSREPRVVELAKELSERRAELSRLVNLPEPDKDAIADSRAAVERLEVELAGLSREFQIQLAKRALDWQQVRSELPRGSALLSLRAFSPRDLVTGDSEEPHWLALLIPADPGDGPELLLRDLGPVAPTVQAQLALRKTYSKEGANDLYRLLFGKLDAELTRYDRLYIAADGMLDLVAFARLVVPDGRYWIERQALRQIRTGRDLVQQGPGRSATGGMLVLGGVDYTHFPTSEPTPSVPVATQPATKGLVAVNRRLRDERGEFGNLRFTGSEAKAVGQLYGDPDGPKAQVWRSQCASENRLKTRLESLASPPRILHLATHGFFFERKSERTERPMTLAGLALAGANAGMKGERSSAGEDGVLYALEVQNLNLEGTELVTLSACDTGKGEVDYSEGVYGLVRAFRIAGARNLLMTLWSLNDRLASDFMRDFYATWFQDPERHPAQALRETQLAWIRAQDSRRSDPNYWAPYVLIEGQ